MQEPTLAVQQPRLRSALTIHWLLAALLSLVAPLAHAWGAATHRLIAELAQEQLRPSTVAKLQALLELEPGATLPSISTWADEIRSPMTAHWHYVNFNRDGACQYEAEKNCPHGQCLVQTLERQAGILSNASTPEDRLVALKWVVHLVGDAHQPLHAGFAEDKGGNQFQVRAFGRGTHLHALWDSGFVSNWPGGPQSLRQAIAQAPAAQSRAFEPSAWSEESCRVASSDGFYPEGRQITEAYAQHWAPVLTERIRAAADRLARLLEAALP